MTAKEYTQSAPRWADDAMQLALRVGGTKADAEDAVQESLASLWQRHGDISLASGRSYLLGATYRQLMMAFRRRRTEQKHAADLAGTPAVQADTRFDLRDAIGRAMLVLTPQQRAILQLRDVEGYAYSEIGAMLDLSVDQVQVYLFRARVTMRKQLRSMGYGTNQ